MDRHALDCYRKAGRIAAECREWAKEHIRPGVPIRTVLETVETMKDRAEIWKWRREMLVMQARLGGATEAQAEASAPKVTLQVLDVSFDAIADLKERAYFMNLPTSFALPPEEVDRLREMAGSLLRNSPDYESIVREFGGMPVK